MGKLTTPGNAPRRFVMALARWQCHAGLLVILGSLTACFDSYPRHALPPALVETARVPGYESVRFWGDEFSNAFDATILAKDEQVRGAATSEHEPQRLDKADFLSISGGGDQGAFAAGLLKGWSERGTRPVFEVVTGVSAGALAAPFAFLGPDYDATLRKIYTQLGAGDLFESRGVRGYFNDALNDTTPLHQLITSFATDAFMDRIAGEYRKGRRIFVLTTNLDAQRPVVWDLTAIAASTRADRRELFVKVLMASSALPGIFPPVRIPVVAADGATYEELHVDGGVTAELIFVPPEMKLLKMEQAVFGKTRLRNLYVIRNGKIAPEYQLVEPRSLALASRGVATLVKYQVISDLYRLSQVAQANNTMFYYHAVPTSFDAVSQSEFDKAYAGRLFDIGHDVGKGGAWSTTPPMSPELVLK